MIINSISPLSRWTRISQRASNYPVYGGSGELDMAVTMVGYGKMGVYTDEGWNPVNGTYGTRREGASVVQEVLDKTIHLSFDGGENPAYCIAAPGDSGGAVFAAISDQTTLIGVPTNTSGYPAQPGYGCPKGERGAALDHGI